MGVMVGICGVVGTRDHPIERLRDGVAWRDDEVATSYRDGDVAVSSSFHRSLVEDPPETAEVADVHIWVWGEVYGFGSGDDYSPRPSPPAESASYCARLYDTYGLGFVPDLNGDFAILIYNREVDTVSFVTDRVATRPIYYACPSRETLVFASNSQVLTRYPSVDVYLDPGYLYEYLQLRRVFGTATPFSGVHEVPPGSVVTVDLDDLSTNVWRYWAPSYDPIERPISEVIDEFVETLSTVLTEWTRDDRSYGLFLSGGSDSRAVQAAMDQRLTAFHIADWDSREARIARQAAQRRGDTFRLLERDSAYDDRALPRNAPLANFSGWFDQAYATGFQDEIVDEVDCLVSGLYADMLFSDGPFLNPRLSLGPLGDISLPIRPRIDSLDDYVAMQTAGAIEPYPCGSTPRPIHDVVRANITWINDQIESHGVRYESLASLVLYGDFYPMSADTDAIFSRSLAQILPYRTPFLDNRLLDLSMQVPVVQRVRTNIVERGITRLDPQLAALPHARTGVPLDKSFYRKYLGGLLNQFWWTHVADDEPPEPHYDHGPWPNRAALLRQRPFARETMETNRDVLETLPLVDYERAHTSYTQHLEGTDNTTVLYSLLTLLGMPAIRAMSTPEDVFDQDPLDHPDTTGNPTSRDIVPAESPFSKSGLPPY